jgi:hypothetical protein
MKAYTEKRAGQRCKYEAPVTCAYFNSECFYHAKTINHSRDGIYFESDFPLKPGASIYIRVENCQSKTSGHRGCNCGGVRMLTLAEVKWCKEIQGENTPSYGVGLKYYAPDI